MKVKLAGHIFSILLVVLAVILLVRFVANEEVSRQTAQTSALLPYLQLDSINFGDPLHRALFRETLDIFHPDRSAANDSLVQAMQRLHQERFASKDYKTGTEERGLTLPTLGKLGPMYGMFVLSYLIVMVLTYYAARTLAIFRFVTEMQRRTASSDGMPGSPRPWNPAATVLHGLTLSAKAVGYTVLFAPAYVIAYSVRSGFDTDSFLFMIILAVISNGLLITATNRFYTFLVGESRKGYVETAIVKNLDSSYAWSAPDGIPPGAVLRPGNLLSSHILQHIYLNARFQYLPSLKEHASFLITGLIIIEMALNIHGHLGYEMLQNILYRQYDVVLTIILAIFLLIKATDIGVDLWFHRESRKYENRS